jgi:hypothetical protein
LQVSARGTRSTQNSDLFGVAHTLLADERTIDRVDMSMPDARMPQARLEASINALFRRCPPLCGFTVEYQSALLVGEVTIHPAHAAPHRALRGEIVAVLAALLEELPEAGELLRGRTFARTFH